MRNDPDIAAERYSTLKTFTAGVVCGLLLCWLGVSLSAGKLGGVGDRVERVWNVLSSDESTTTTVTP